MALWDIHLRFTWQAWHVWHWAGSGGALGSHVPEWSPRLFAWQAWHLETFIFVSRGRRGTWWHPPSFHVAGVVLDLLTLRGRRGTYGTGLALVARSVPTCPSGRRGFLRGRRGTWRHSSSFHVTSVVLGDIHLRFTWQAWYSTYSHTTCSHTTYLHATYSCTTCTHTTYSCRRGTWRHGSSLCVAGVARMALGWLWWRARFPRARVVAAAFCVAGVALGDIHLRFTWQAWHLVTSTFVSCGRRGTRLTHFAWQAWHVWHWASSGGALGSHVPEWSPRLFAWQAWHLETFIFVSRGRRGTWWHPPSFHVAGVVLDLLTHNLFTHNLLARNLLTHNLHTYNLLMQAWHLETWIVTLRGRRGTYGTGLALVAPSLPTCPSGRRGFLRGRRGAWRHSSCGTWWRPPSFHAAGVVLDLLTLRGRRGTYGTGLALVARSVPTCPSGRRGFLRGRRGTWRHSSSFHVASVVLGDIHLRFTWQAWYSTYSHTTYSHATYSHATYSRTTCTHTTYSRRRRTWRYGSTLCVAGVARMALGWLWWRARFPRARVVAAAFCVAGVALGDIHLVVLGDVHLHVAGVVLDLLTLRGRRGTYGTGLALVARSVPTCPSGRRGFLRGRRGTWRHSSSFHVAGVVLGDIHLRFTWQAWYSTYSHTTYSHATYSRTTCTHTTYSRRRRTWRYGSSLCVAGVARMALGWLWWRARFPRARVVAAAFCVAGVALGDIHLRFTWQAWHLVTSTFVSRGRRGTQLTHFAWQAWHVWHWASSGGALGSHVPEWSPRLFAWQAWHLETFIFVSRGMRGIWWHRLGMYLCCMFGADEIVVPAWSVAIWHHIYIYIYPYIHPSIHPSIHPVKFHRHSGCDGLCPRCLTFVLLSNGPCLVHDPLYCFSSGNCLRLKALIQSTDCAVHCCHVHYGYCWY